MTISCKLSQPFVEDPTNDDLRMTRNRIRHDLLPKLIADYNPETVSALLRLGETARDAHTIISAEVQRFLETVVTTNPARNQVEVDCRGLAGRERHLIRELFVSVWKQQDWPLQAMGFAEWDAIAELAMSAHEPAPQRLFPGQISAQKTGERLSLARL